MTKKSRKAQISIPEEIVFEVLKELPAKSLLRFRCVSHHWLSTIDDPSFIAAHSTRSHTRPGGTTILARTRDSQFFSLNPEGGSPPLPLKTPAFMFPRDPFPFYFQSVHGLLCFGNTVWNPSTRQTLSLPWDYNRWPLISHRLLGFAPSTNQYKVLTIYGESISAFQGQHCKVLTLGTHQWRNVDVLPWNFSEFVIGRVCYVNGTIYCMVENTRRETKILAFDVEQEKFRLISLPNHANRWPDLIQIGECLAAMDGYAKKMWILDDKGEWSRASFIIPGLSTYVGRFFGSIHTGELLLLQGRFRNSFKLFYYNVDNKSLRRIDFPDSRDCQPCEILFTKQVECLFRWKKSN